MTVAMSTGSVDQRDHEYAERAADERQRQFTAHAVTQRRRAGAQIREQREQRRGLGQLAELLAQRRARW